MNRRRQFLASLLIWASVFLLAIAWVWGKRDASLWNGDYIPFGYDAFYHAKRILAVAAGAPLAQFDPLMHVPGGSWIPWPWAYDWILGQGVRAAAWLLPATPPMQVLAYVPLAGLGLSLALLIAAARRLRLGAAAVLFAAATFALAPQALGNHLLGSVDHHWAEAVAFLFALVSGLRWNAMRTPGSAALHAVALALAPGVQNGLFLLQVFTLMTLSGRWLCGDAPTSRDARAFALVLIVVTVALLLPSAPFRQGWSQYYFLGTFHLMAAVATAIFAVLLARAPRTRGGFAMLIGFAALVALLLGAQLREGGAFIAAGTDALAGIQETASVVRSLARDGFSSYLATNTAVPLLALFAWAALAWWRRADAEFWWLLVYAGMGCVLFLLQLRFWAYGLAAGSLLAAAVIQEAVKRSNEPVAAKHIAVALATIGALAPTARALDDRYPVAGSEWFGSIQSVVPVLREACRERPLTVLADPNYGHFISYFSGCAVITNNFIIGPHDYATRARAARLYALSPDAFLAEAGDIDLVIADVHPGRLAQLRETGRLQAGDETPALKQRLLDNNLPPPPGFESLMQADATVRGDVYSVLRLLRVVHVDTRR